MEYGNSCMGYEIAGGLGAKMADPSRDVWVMVGDASFLMMSSEISTSIQEGYKLNIVILDNHGFSSIGGLSRAIGSEGFGTDYRYRSAKTGQLDGDTLPVDFVQLAAGLGAHAVRATTLAEVEQALEAMRGHRPHQRRGDRGGQGDARAGIRILVGCARSRRSPKSPESARHARSTKRR